MIKLEKEDKKWITEHLDTIERIVKNASCSFITTEFRTGVIEIAKRYGFSTCDHCNTELYLAVVRLYSLFCSCGKKQNKNGNE